MDEKIQTSFRLTPEAKALLALLARHFGLRQTGWIEMTIRQEAERLGIHLPTREPPRET